MHFSHEFFCNDPAFILINAQLNYPYNLAFPL